MASGVASWKITFSANGGTGEPAAIQGSYGGDFPINLTLTKIPSGVPTRTGYTFLGWSLSASATSATWVAGDNFTRVLPSPTYYTYALYAVWQQKTYTIYYRPGSSTIGSNYSQTKNYGVSLTLRGLTYTRSGYVQVGWSTSDGGEKAYELGGTYTANASVYLYPVWQGLNSTIASLSDSVEIDGTTTGSLSITRYDSSYTHTVEYSFGSYSFEHSGVGTSDTFTIPTSWLAGLPNSISGIATCTVTTYSGSEQIGNAVSKTFTITVPDSVVPTVSLSGTNNSTNATIQGWNVLVQGFSTITLAANAAGVQGSTITNIAFTGDGVNQSGTGTSVTSSVLTAKGSRPWSVTVTDSRGRTATATLTRTVYEYYTPSCSMRAERCLNDGTSDPSSGTYIKANASYSFASCGGNNAVTAKIEYKVHTAQSWTTGVASALVNTDYVFGGANIAIVSNYDVRLTVTDSLGNAESYIIIVSSVNGVSFGLNGKCARFGGPIQYNDRFHCDWDSQFDGEVVFNNDVVFNRRTSVDENFAIESGYTLRIGNTTITEAQLIALLNLIS